MSIKDFIRKAVIASAGLFLFGFGVYLTIQANLGAAPWDAFNLGLSSTIGIKYGTASIVMSLIILCIDILLKEKIGVGMFLDAFIVGKTVDLFNLLNIVPAQTNLAMKLLTIFAGMVIMGFSQYLYMTAALGCGPRDTLLVGLKRKISRVPIGVISIVILTVVTVIGWLLGGPIGIGTVICAGLEGPIMQLAFRIVKFVPTDVEHQSILDTFAALKNKKEDKEK